MEKIHSFLFVNFLVKPPMRYLSNIIGNSFNFGRNVIDMSTMSETNKRPDFLVWNTNAILVLRGEEKDKFGNMNEALNELTQKCGDMAEMYFGHIPYLFCYAAAGPLVQFCVINRKKDLLRLHDSYHDKSKIV